VKAILSVLQPGSVATRIGCALVICLVAYASLTPQLVVPDAVPDRTDLVIHLIMHLVLTGSLLVAWPRRFTLMLVLGLGLAIFFEVAQIFVDGRDFDIADLVANLVGAALGAGASQIYSRWFEPS
jgi:VanZ family protein